MEALILLLLGRNKRMWMGKKERIVFISLLILITLFFWVAAMRSDAAELLIIQLGQSY